MPNIITELSILDRSAQLLGLAQISSPQQIGSRTAKALQRAYPTCKLAELQNNMWHFAIKRALLPASASPPVHTKKKAFPLPPDFLQLAPEDQYNELQVANDWIMEGGMIITDEEGPLPIRYVSQDVSESLFDPLFAESLSANVAMLTCQELTNSTTQITTLSQIYDMQIDRAKRRGAIVAPKAKLPVSSWISRRG